MQWQYGKAHQTNMKLKDEVTNLLHVSIYKIKYIYIHHCDLGESLTSFSFPCFIVIVMLFVSTTSSRRKPNSPNSPSATRRRKDLQVKGMLLQMLARPRGQNGSPTWPEVPNVLTLHDSGGTLGPLQYSNEKIAKIEKPMFATLRSDYQTQFTTLIRLKGVITTKKPLGCWQKSNNHQQGYTISVSNAVWRKGVNERQKCTWNV